MDCFRGKKVLVTGHTGFKGSWLTLWLNNLGAEVYGISLGEVSNPSIFSLLSLEKYISSDFIDIRNNELIDERIKNIKPDFIFHLAAQSLVSRSYSDPLETISTNTLGTANILQSINKHCDKCIAIIITSDKCYENKEWIWGYRETDKFGGKDPYSASKGAAELIIHSYIQSFFNESDGIRIGIGRAGNVIGGGDWAPDRIIPDCMQAWSENKVVDIRNPEATRPWQHVLEPLSGYLTLATKLFDSNELHGEAFNFGPSDINNYSVRELIDSLKIYWDRVEWRDISGDKNMPEAGLLKLVCDKALQKLSWRSCLDFDETVQFTADWYKHYYESKADKMYDYTIEQILQYVEHAKNRDIFWAK